MTILDQSKSKIRLKIITATVLLSVILIYVGTKPSTGTTLVFSRGNISVFFLITFITLLTKLVKFFKRRRQSDQQHTLYCAAGLSVLTILSLILIWHLEVLERDAISRLRNKAEEIQKQCAINGICPENIDGWYIFPGRPGLRRYEPIVDGTRYVFEYNNYHKASFTMFINYGPDMGYYLTGGINTPVTTGRRR